MAPSATSFVLRRWPTFVVGFVAFVAAALLPVGATVASASGPTSAAASGVHSGKKTTFFVAPGGTASSCGTNSASDPFGTVEAALACAGNGDVVKLAPTTGKAPYGGIGTVDHDVTIEASGGTARSVSIDVSATAGPLVVAAGGSVTLQGVTLECAAATRSTCPAADATNHGTLVLQADTVTDNLSHGVLNESTATGPANLKVLSSTIDDNTGVLGGTTRGAGINSLVASGVSTPTSVEPALTVDNSTIADNGVGGEAFSGGGISVRSGAATLVNDTIAGNVAEQAGGGIYATAGTHVALSNTLIAGNTAGEDPDCYSYNGGATPAIVNGPGGHNLIGKGAGCSELANATDGDIVGVANPGLATVANNGGPTNTMALEASSPAIGAANPATCVTVPIANVDQRNRSRHATTRGCDIGAYDTGGTGGAVEATFFVAPGGTASSCGTNSASDPFGTVEAALACAGNGDVVKLAPTTGKAPYGGIGTVDHDVTIEASGGTARSVSIDVSATAGPLVVAAGGSVTLQGVTLECAAATRSTCPAADATNHGTLVLQADTVTDNLSHGVLNESTATGPANLKVLSSTIDDNTGVLGGTTRGAGINSLVASGVSTPTSVEPALTVDNSTIADNGVGGEAFSGGGISVRSGAATLVNDTIAGNVAEQAGGGIYATAGTHVALSNTLIAGNTAGEDPDCYSYNGGATPAIVNGPGGHNLIGKGAGCSELANATDGDIVGVANPGLATVANNGGPTNTMALEASSPAIGAANPATCVTVPIANVDQRNRSRHATTRGCDIGAYDTGGAPVVGSVSPSTGPAAGHQSVTLTGTDFSGATTVTFGGVPGSNVVVSSTMVTVTTPTHRKGTVTVQVTNAYGASTTLPSGDLYTYKATVPAKPGAPSATPGNRSANVTWTAPTTGGSPITKYTVTSDPGKKTCTTSGALTCTVDGLAPGKSYTFTVVAKNAVGSSLPSTPSNPVTP